MQHWPHLRKHNGERYAYSSHSQAVLDCLRNRSEWARLVDRGPKVRHCNYHLCSHSIVIYLYLFSFNSNVIHYVDLMIFLYRQMPEGSDAGLMPRLKVLNQRIMEERKRIQKLWIVEV